MKKSLYLLTLLLIVQISFGQEMFSDEKIEIGTPYETVVAQFNKYYTFKDLIFGIKINREKITLQTYNIESLTQEKIKVYDDFLKELKIEEILRIKDKLFLFYSFYNEITNKESLYFREIDVEECSFKEGAKLLFEIEENVTSSMEFQQLVDNLDFRSSFDGNKLLIQYLKRPDRKLPKKQRKNALSVIGFKVFDQKLNLIWSKEIEMPYKYAEMKNKDYAIDTDGNCYLVSLIGSDFILFKIAAQTGILSKNKIEIASDQIIENLKLFQISDKSIICAGYTLVIASLEGSESGIFKYNILDTTPEIDHYVIPLKIVYQNATKIRLNSFEAGHSSYKKVYSLSIKSLVPELLFVDKDGSMLLIGEQNIPISRNYGAFVPASSGISPLIGISSGHMLYNDVLITKFNKDGSLAWVNKLAKHQETVNRTRFDGLEKRGLSYKFIDGENDLYIIYTDHKKNLNLDSIKAPKPNDFGNEGVLVAYEINKNSGVGKKTPIFEVRKIKEIRTSKFSLSRMVTKKKDELIIEIYDGSFKDILIKKKVGNDVLLKIKLK
ncbi:MAG: hypothetical protein JKX68_05795 [Flavobacteriales bacterium]|nr:hypothetical protein [Flavobacteriales bacterium]